MKRPRLRKWAKWACTLAAAILAGVTIVGAFFRCGWHGTTADGSIYRTVMIEWGTLRVVDYYGLSKSELPKSSSLFLQRSAGWGWGPWTWKSGTESERMFHAGFRYWRGRYD